MRKPFNFKSLNEAVILTIKTKSPEKWLLVDKETGQVFQGSDKGCWDRLDPVMKLDKDE
jgi:hypothetical protein